MLDPWIIEEIRRREEALRREREALYIELPLYDSYREESAEPKEPEEPQRGVTVIDL